MKSGQCDSVGVPCEFSCSCGASAVAGAAYRSGECLTDERTGEEHDHRDRDDLDAAEILAPRDSPEWAQDRARLWNAVEAAERRQDAQVAREIRVAIPRELPPEDGRALVRDFAQRAFVDREMVADIAYHGREGDKNPHAHIMLTTRTISSEGLREEEAGLEQERAHRDLAQGLGRLRQIAPWRALAATRRIDHRTLVAQRDEALKRGDTARADELDRDPQVRHGRAAWMHDRTGKHNDRTLLAKEIDARTCRPTGHRP